MEDGRPVLTVTLNPALDVTYEVDGVDWSDVNRPAATWTRPGGKGLNVARTLHAAGYPVVATGLLGGRTGQAVLSALEETGITGAFSQSAGETRRTFVVLDTRVGRTASFYEPGPHVDRAEFAAFSAQYRSLLDGCAAVVLSGSLPPGLPPDAYGQLISIAAAAGVPSVLDTGGQSLQHGVAAGPDIAKPNLAELEAWSGQPLRDGNGLVDHAAVATAGGCLRRAGAKSAVISLGADGLVAMTPGTVWQAQTPAPIAGNATGAGDAVAAALALWLAGRLPDPGWAGALRHAAALGAATVASPVAGEFSAEVYQQALAEIVVTSAEGDL
jgi:tagatose 6-phosphate kinase